ncbi:LOW QUALITY PROTEIN: WD repeat-containing protein 75-like [Haliotis rubra]|uniref:LOW QUALITY PROTEIN: WD repeat-containing protein 75-like n=1 Tax=Haliotis rubra TaxID=36100 RepID=UPI001EE577A1|nr:LOW QUALITY PROTEIN: WD repeat-containing protein 75-like [Haliotis rubra]
MATTMPHVDIVDDKPIVCLRAGESIVQTKPIFSHDSKCLFCGSGNAVKVYSTESGECVRELQAHTDQVTCLMLNPANKLQLISSGLDAQVFFWDYIDGVMLKSYKFPQPLHSLVSVNISKGQFSFHVLQTSPRKQSLTEGQVSRTEECQRILKPQNKVSSSRAVHLMPRVAIGHKDNYFAGVSTNRKELIIHYNKKCIKYKMQYVQITCVSAHPTELALATGCSDGKIYYWYSFTNEKQMVKSVYHWHSLAVLDLTFSPEGSLLLSGGHECTLVKWQYETHYKDFKPRLGSPITHVTCAPDNLLYAVSHRDNGIHLIRNTLDICQIYQGLTKTSFSHGNPVGLLCDPRSRAVVTNGRPGHLQFYCVHSDRQLFNLDIVRQNYISSENLEQPLTVTQITKAAIDERGDWLATYELWDDGEMSPEMQLKFWLFDQEKQRYEMNTVVDRPHDKALGSLTFRPYNSSISSMLPLVVSGGHDRRFKLWTLVDDTDIYRSNSKWTCDSVGFYREMDTGATAFAEDGSLLAVVFESTITLWDPDTNVLRTTFSSSFDKKNIRQVLFGRKSCCHLLVATTAWQLTVWNLLTCSVQWSVSIGAVVLVDDPLTKYMSVFTHSGDLHVFEPANSKPVFTQTQVSKKDVVSAVFIPHKEESPFSAKGRLLWQRQSQLYFMTKEQDLLTVQYEVSEDSTDGYRKKTPIKQNLPQSALSLLMSKHRKSAVKDRKHEHIDMSVGMKETQFIQQMCSMSAVAQPPLPDLCLTFLETRLSKGTTARAEVMEDEEEDDIDDIDSGLQLNIKADSDSDMEVTEGSRPPSAKKENVSHADLDTKKLDRALGKEYRWFESLIKP